MSWLTDPEVWKAAALLLGTEVVAICGAIALLRWRHEQDDAIKEQSIANRYAQKEARAADQATRA